MCQIYVKANTDAQLQKLKRIFVKKHFNVNYSCGEYRFMPILIDVKEKKVFNITSASICHCLFNEAKKSLIDYNDFETIFIFKEN